MASTAFPGHAENTVVRRVKDSTSGSSISKEVPCPIMLTQYNKSIGGVDKSDQYISYHKILRPTVKYWCFFHSVDIITVNSHIVYNWYRLRNNSAILSENQFRDLLILDIIQKYGLQKNYRKSKIFLKHFTLQNFAWKHTPPHKSPMRLLWTHGKYSLTQRRCSDCHLQPVLCIKPCLLIPLCIGSRSTNLQLQYLHLWLIMKSTVFQHRSLLGLPSCCLPGNDHHLHKPPPTSSWKVLVVDYCQRDFSRCEMMV